MLQYSAVYSYQTVSVQGNKMSCPFLSVDHWCIKNWWGQWWFSLIGCFNFSPVLWHCCQVVGWELYYSKSIFHIFQKNKKESLDSAHNVHNYLCSKVMHSFSRLIIYLLITIWLAAYYFVIIVKYYVTNTWCCSKLYTNILMEHLKPKWCIGLRTKNFWRFLSYKFGNLVYLYLEHVRNLYFAMLMVDVTSYMDIEHCYRHDIPNWTKAILFQWT